MSKIPYRKAAFFGLVIFLAGFVAIKIHRIDTHLRELSKGGKRFSPAHIVSEFDHNPAWDVKVSDDLYSFVNVITQQPFFWLSKGFQAYAFVSEDNEYVIKFFQQQRLRERPFLEHPFAYIFHKSFRDKCAYIKHHREEIFSSSKLVFEEIPEETGILFVHLNKTVDLLRGIRLRDSAGQSFKIKPDRVSFIIQRKAQYVLPTLTQCMKEGKVDMAKARLDQIFDLLLTLAKKGIVDSDYALIRNNNIGFTKDRAIYIDTGHITKNVNLDAKKQMEYEFRKRLRPLYDWLTIKYPELAAYFDMRKVEILASMENTASTANIASAQ